MLETITDARGIARKIERREHAPHVVRTGWMEGTDRHGLVVTFGLHMIRGNSAPYFTLTANGYVNGLNEYGGPCHDIVARELPELADICAMHGSSIDGVPMHAEANGWYQLAGACGGFGERYHAGNQEFRRVEPLVTFAEHCRITLAEAAQLAEECKAYDVMHRESLRWADRVSGKGARICWTLICDGMRARWKREADETIEKYGLAVFGNPWPA